MFSVTSKPGIFYKADAGAEAWLKDGGCPFEARSVRFIIAQKLLMGQLVEVDVEGGK